MNMSLTIKEEVVGPDRAAELLRGNTANRALRPKLVERYARDMEAGQWHHSGDPVRVDTKGMLLDGQHRLHAVIKAGAKIPMVIISGVETKAMLTMDTGAKRRFADHLRIQGHTNTSQLASAVRWCVTYERGSMGAHDAVSHSELDEWLNNNPEISEVCRHVAAKTFGPIGSRMRLVLSVLRFYSVRTHDFDLFMSRLLSGVGLEEGDPIHMLRRFVENSMIGKKPSPLVMQAVSIKAWNAYMEGERPKLLTYRAGGAAPEAFPEIITGA